MNTTTSSGHAVNEVGTNAEETIIIGTPAEALQAIDGDSERAGGPYVPPVEYLGSIGRTMFDVPTSKDGSVTGILPQSNIEAVPGQALVRIKSAGDKRVYLGAVVQGPFAEPDGLRADSTPMIVSAVHGSLLVPKYHGRVQIELLSEELSDGTTIPPRRRPNPNSPIFQLNPDEAARVLRSEGNLRLGLADGYEQLVVRVPGDSKGVFPRHVGILGTTGGGKSTTVSGLVCKAQIASKAVVLIDVEGEYCAINEPTEDARMLQALKQRGLQPAGVQNTTVYHLVGRETKNPKHPRIRQFSLRFSDLSPYAVQEVLELNDAQEERFFKAYDVTKAVLEQLKIWPSNATEKSQLLELDELESGYPKMTLAHLYDVVAAISAKINKEEQEPNLETSQFAHSREVLKRIIDGSNVPGNGASWRKVLGKVGQVKRLKVFDSPKAPPLDYATMLNPGEVSIIDLSDTDSPYIRNLVIAQLLRGVQLQQDKLYSAAVAGGDKPLETTVFVEEAHEFLSAARIKQMTALFDQVARIARRGRKRWLGLVFISQMPQHLPDEVLSLINNWVLHKIADSGVVTRLKNSIAGVGDSQWRNLPSLAAGQAVVAFTTLARPLQISVDPTPCKLLMVD